MPEILTFILTATGTYLAIDILCIRKRRHYSSTIEKELEILRAKNADLIADKAAWQEKELQLKEDIASIQAEMMQLIGDKSSLKASLAEKEIAYKREFEQIKDMKKQLEDSFKSLSSDVLAKNSREFLTLANQNLQKYQSQAQGELEKRQTKFDELIKPIKETLGNMDKKIIETEKERMGAFKVLCEQIQNLKQSETSLQKETANLVTALRRPNVRGRWGEITLRNVVEMAGMSRFCDFNEQVATDGGKFRPDMIVRLPNNREIVVDSKAPLEAYLDSIEAKTEDEKKIQLDRHAEHIAKHIDQLSSKNYTSQFENAPEFVVLFLPGEMFFSAALEHKPDLNERGMSKQVILATPTTLIALLKAVAYGWRQEEVAQAAKEIHKEGLELTSRLAVLMGHIANIGKHLGKSVDAYNSSIGSMETKLMPQARRLNQLVQSNKEIAELSEIDTKIREFKSNTE